MSFLALVPGNSSPRSDAVFLIGTEQMPVRRAVVVVVIAIVAIVIVMANLTLPHRHHHHLLLVHFLSLLQTLQRVRCYRSLS